MRFKQHVERRGFIHEAIGSPSSSAPSVLDFIPSSTLRGKPQTVVEILLLHDRSPQSVLPKNKYASPMSDKRQRRYKGTSDLETDKENPLTPSVTSCTSPYSEMRDHHKTLPKYQEADSFVITRQPVLAGAP